MPLKTPEGLIQNLHEAAAGELPWTAALEAFDRHVGATGTVILNLSRDVLPFSSESLEETTSAYVREGWHLVDARFRATPMMRGGKIVSDLDIFTAEHLARLPFYQEFIFRHDLKWWGGMVLNAAGREYCFSIQRSARQGQFTSRDHQILNAMRSHLAGAMILQEARLKAREEGILDILDALEHPAFALSPMGKVTRWNARASRLVGHGLHIVDGRLAAGTAGGRSAVEDLVNQVRNRALSPSAPTKPVLVPREDGRPLILSVIGDCASVGDLFATGGTIVLASDPDDRPKGGEELLGLIFGLTRSEAKLAAHLAIGTSLADYGAEMKLADSTVRTLMKHVLAKSDTRRQAEFVALANRVLAGRRRQGE